MFCLFMMMMMIMIMMMMMMMISSLQGGKQSNDNIRCDIILNTSNGSGMITCNSTADNTLCLRFWKRSKISTPSPGGWLRTIPARLEVHKCRSSK